MNVLRLVIGGCVALAAVMVGLSTAAAEEEAVFELEEVSVFEEAKADGMEILVSGSYVGCYPEPHTTAQKYPELKSDRPLYGELVCNRSPIDPSTATSRLFVIDESAATGKGYDRLYFDANGDFDLTNDPVVKALKEPPPGAVAQGERAENYVFFDSLALDLDPDPKLGTGPLPVMPRLMVRDRNGPYGRTDLGLRFLPTVARKGKITIGNQEYTALLAQVMAITGRFDRPSTGLYVTPVGSEFKQSVIWWNQFLGTVRRIDGTLYYISATPTGDQLTVRPYRGEFGTFQVGSGDRKIDAEKMGAVGLLMSESGFLFPLGDFTDIASFYASFYAKRPREHKLPVGDYRPLMLAVDYGDLGIDMSPPRVPPAEGAGPSRAAPAYGIKIRKDRPYVLDFSGKPVVSFTSPAMEKTFKPGGEVRIEALLTDPALGTMLGGLEDRTRKEQDLEIELEGKKVTIPRYASFDPTVSIADSSGKEVANGKMPFG